MCLFSLSLLLFLCSSLPRLWQIDFIHGVYLAPASVSWLPRFEPAARACGYLSLPSTPFGFLFFYCSTIDRGGIWPYVDPASQDHEVNGFFLFQFRSHFFLTQVFSVSQILEIT